MKAALRTILFKRRAAAVPGDTAASFIIGGSAGFGSTTFAFPTSGVAAGDILIVEAQGNFGPVGTISVTGSTALTLLSVDSCATGQYTAAYWIVLTDPLIAIGTLDQAADSLGGCSMSVYRGATTVTFKEFATSASGDTTLVFTGFSPSGSTKGVVVGMSDRTDSGTPTITATSWAARVTGSTTYFSYTQMDRLTGYGGAGITFSGFETGTGANAGHLLELT